MNYKIEFEKNPRGAVSTLPANYHPTAQWWDSSLSKVITVAASGRNRGKHFEKELTYILHDHMMPVEKRVFPLTVKISCDSNGYIRKITVTPVPYPFSHWTAEQWCSIIRVLDQAYSESANIQHLHPLVQSPDGSARLLSALTKSIGALP